MPPSDLAIDIKVFPHGEGLPLPSYQTEQSAGMDLLAAVKNTEVLEPGTIALIPSGIAIAIPTGFEGQIRPRSGLAVKQGITVVNSPGTIDSDYRGEIRVGLINLSKEPFHISRGMRIAQLIVLPVPRVVWAKVESLPDTKRGGGGFGHTGE